MQSWQSRRFFKSPGLKAMKGFNGDNQHVAENTATAIEKSGLWVKTQSGGLCCSCNGPCEALMLILKKGIVGDVMVSALHSNLNHLCVIFPVHLLSFSEKERFQPEDLSFYNQTCSNMLQEMLLRSSHTLEKGLNILFSLKYANWGPGAFHWVSLVFGVFFIDSFKLDGPELTQAHYSLQNNNNNNNKHSHQLRGGWTPINKNNP